MQERMGRVIRIQQRIKLLQESMEESDRFHDLLDTIFYITELAGFEIEGRIVLKDCKTGKVWR